MKKVLCVCIGLITLSGNLAWGINIPGLFNTGVDDLGERLAFNSTDQHYVLTGPNTDHAICSDPTVWHIDNEGTWCIPDETETDAWWISTPIYEADAGDYVYTLDFDLSGYDPETIVISGEWASDNESVIYLNGIETSFTNYGVIPNENTFRLTYDFSVNSGFISGWNALEFHVNNQSGPTGLLVQNLQATPEPATLSLLLLGGMAAMRRRKA